MALNPTVDVFWEGYGLSSHGTGITVFASQLSAALAKENCYPKIVGKDRRGIFGLKPLSPLLSFHQAKRDFLLKHNSSKAIFHGLNNFNLPWLPLRASEPFRFVLTVHDTIPLIADSGVSQKLEAQFRFLFPKALRHADAVVFVSSWTKNRVLELYPEHAGKTEVIRLGRPIVKAKKRSFNDNTPVRILSVGRHEPYKRLELLLEIARLGKGAVIVDLVTDKLGKIKFTRLLEEKALTNCFTVYSGLSEIELSNLYQHADVYVQPSLYEGFCLPAVEALSTALPVVYCRGSALDESIGAAGMPLDRAAPTEQWLQSIYQAAVLAASTSWPEVLEKTMQAQTTWEDCAFSYLKLYAKLLEQ